MGAASESEASQGTAFTMAEEEEDVQGLKIKEDFEDFHVKIMALNEQIKSLDDDFNSLANSKAIELEGIGKKEEGEMERHKHLYEIKQLVEMERKLQKMEFEKIKLIQKEARVTANLAKIARMYGANLEELEEMYEAESRRRELVLTKLYARLNNRIRLQVENAEGNLKTQMRSRTGVDNENGNRLFDGIRD